MVPTRNVLVGALSVFLSGCVWMHTDLATQALCPWQAQADELAAAFPGECICEGGHEEIQALGHAHHAAQIRSLRGALGVECP